MPNQIESISPGLEKKILKPESRDYNEKANQQLLILMAVVTQINQVKYWQKGQDPLAHPFTGAWKPFAQEWVKWQLLEKGSLALLGTGVPQACTKPTGKDPTWAKIRRIKKWKGW